MSNLKIRPHHGLCIVFFEGKGYNPEFINNMTLIIESLNNNPTIQLVTSEDSICAACPNINQQTCSQETKVQGYDKSVLDLCNLKADQMLSWEEFSNLVHTAILNKNNLYKVCGDCSWSIICHSKQKAKEA